MLLMPPYHLCRGCKCAEQKEEREYIDHGENRDWWRRCSDRAERDGRQETVDLEAWGGNYWPGPIRSRRGRCKALCSPASLVLCAKYMLACFRIYACLCEQKIQLGQLRMLIHFPKGDICCHAHAANFSNHLKDNTCTNYWFLPFSEKLPEDHSSYKDDVRKCQSHFWNEKRRIKKYYSFKKKESFFGDLLPGLFFCLSFGASEPALSPSPPSSLMRVHRRFIGYHNPYCHRLTKSLRLTNLCVYDRSTYCVRVFNFLKICLFVFSQHDFFPPPLPVFDLSVVINWTFRF